MTDDEWMHIKGRIVGGELMHGGLSVTVTVEIPTCPDKEMKSPRVTIGDEVELTIKARVR